MDRKEEAPQKKASISCKLREFGNLRFRRKEYEKAEEMFSESIVRAREAKCAEDEMLALSNRAITRMKRRQYELALKDCDVSIEISERNGALSAEKAYFRRAQCLEKLGLFSKALIAYSEASDVVTNTKAKERCRKAVLKLEQCIHEKNEEKVSIGNDIALDTKQKVDEEDVTKTKIIRLNFTSSPPPPPHPAMISADGCTRYCDSCGMYGAINRCGGCKKTIYCTRNCQESHWPFHKRTCGDVVQPKSLRGKAGLDNVGNTCFLASVVQCLSHTTPITRLLLGNRHIKDINRDNPLGTRDAEVAAEYVSVLKRLWFSSRFSHSPLRLHRAIVQTREEFVNSYSQQDSHELLMFLLDALHEDLNRVLDKPSTEPVEDEGRPDHVVAEETWSRYLLRNSSIVIDFMTGQFKSTVTCPSCERVSVSFDPFTCATLPMIPASAREIKIKITLKRRRGRMEILELKLPLNSKIRDLKDAIASSSNVNQDQMYVVRYCEGRHTNNYKNKIAIRDIEYEDIILVHEFEKPSQGYRHVLVYTYVSCERVEGVCLFVV